MRGGARIEPILAVDGLTVRTKQQVTLIEEVSFSIHAGQILGLVGESGCGKTVTSLALMRLLNPQTTQMTGDITLNGKSIQSLSERAVRTIRGGEIAFIMQNPMSAFTPVYTIGHQMIETIQTHARCSKREAKQQAMTALEEVNLTDPARVLKALSVRTERWDVATGHDRLSRCAPSERPDCRRTDDSARRLQSKDGS